MAISFFDSKAITPNDDMLSGVLSESYELWTELRNHINGNYPNISEEWKFYGKSGGWWLKIKTKKRALIYLTPRDRHFRVRFGISEKMVPIIEASALPAEIIEAVLIATPYAEGRSVDIDIDNKEAKTMAYVMERKLVHVGTFSEKLFEALKTLLQIKFEN